MKSIIKRAFLVILGSLTYSFAIAIFIEPAGLIMGGSTGLGLFAGNVFGISPAVVVGILNTILFLIGWKILGRSFAANTLLSTIVFPVFLHIAEQCAIYIPRTDDLFLCTIFGGMIIGASLGLVIRTGASTGGMDIPPLIMNKYLGTPVSASLWAFDIIILILQALFSNLESIMYGIVLVIVYSVVLDKMLILGKSKTEIKVISEKSEEIKNAILSDIDRGVTILHGRTGYLNEETEIVMSVISSRELVRIERFIHEIDPEAFIIISRISEVRGRGFTRSKKHL